MMNNASQYHITLAYTLKYNVYRNKQYEPPRQKTNNLHMRKQRRRSASQ